MDKSLVVESQGCTNVMRESGPSHQPENQVRHYMTWHMFLEVGSIYLYMHWL
jgi:hypothetical protein